MDLIQAELDRVAEEWNLHRVRCSSEMPGGIPDMLYHLPQEQGMHLCDAHVTLAPCMCYRHKVIQVFGR